MISEVTFVVSFSAENASIARRMEEMGCEWDTAAEIEEQGRSLHPHVRVDVPVLDTIIID